MKFTLSLTHNCNLRCTYCYAGPKYQRDMSVATAKQIVDFAIASTPLGAEIRINLFGGEPFLRFDLMREIVDYAREQEDEHCRHVTIGVTSNGTLLTSNIVDFLRTRRVELCLSIDGLKPIHDRHRVFPSGRGSFDLVWRNLQRAVAEVEDLQVNAVYGPDSVDSLADTVEALTNAGVCVMHLNPDISSPWTQADRAKLPEAWRRVAETYVKIYNNGSEVAVNPIDSKIILFFKGGYGAQDLCGMGESEWGFAPSGNIYPCERFIGADNDLSLCMGNIHTGIEPHKRCAIVAMRGNRNTQCLACGIRRYCMNTCACTNYFMTGHTALTGPTQCAIERAVVDASRSVFEVLSESDNPVFISHWAQCAHSSRPQL